MKKTPIYLALGAVLSLGAAGATQASTILGTNGTPLTYKVHNIDNTPDGLTLQLDTNPGGYLVDYTSTSSLHNNGNSGGFAWVGGAGGLGFADLTIDPESPIDGFTAIKFKLDLPGLAPDIPNGYHLDFTFDARVYYSALSFDDFDNVDMALGGGDHRFIIENGLSPTITAIMLSNLVGVATKNNQPTITRNYNFDAIKQVSFDGVLAGPPTVPEPATWAMMVLGFGGMGALLRRNRRQARMAFA